MNESINLYKQIILHILHRASLSLPQSVVLDVIVNLKYTDYINAQSALGELIESGLVNEETTYHRTYVSATETGEQIRSSFEDKLSPDIRREVDEYLKDHHIETLDETVLVSDYRSTKDNMYIVTCAIRDGSHTLFETSIEVATEADAIRICDSWNEHAEALYSDALKKLLGNNI